MNTFPSRSLARAVPHYTMLIVLSLLCIAPIAVIFATSLRQQVQIFANPLDFIFTPTLENYRAVLQEDKLDRYLLNSLFVGIVSTVITLVLGTSFARTPPAAPLVSVPPAATV